MTGANNFVWQLGKNSSNVFQKRLFSGQGVYKAKPSVGRGGGVGFGYFLEHTSFILVFTSVYYCHFLLTISLFVSSDLGLLC